MCIFFEGLWQQSKQISQWKLHTARRLIFSGDIKSVKQTKCQKWKRPISIAVTTNACMVCVWKDISLYVLLYPFELYATFMLRESLLQKSTHKVQPTFSTHVSECLSGVMTGSGSYAIFILKFSTSCHFNVKGASCSWTSEDQWGPVWPSAQMSF